MKKKRFKRLKRVALAVGILAALVYLNNTSLFSDPVAERPYLIAHRGVAQGFHKEGLTGQTCTAARMTPPEHEYLENTLPSMRAAFAFGADALEFDVHKTVDGRFAVFHDWTVDCRTEGSGVTGEQTLAELQRLDVGYGYTADGGKTFPFRGRGVGMMPSLEQVLAAFPDRDFVIDVKRGDAEEGRLLAERLIAANHGGELMFVGRASAVEAIRERLPEARTMTRPRVKRCLKGYLALGWTGHVPSACERGLLTVPANVAPWLWGWPDRLMQRMERAGTRVVVIGDYHGEGYSQGFDDPGRFRELIDDYRGGIWTDRIDLLGPVSLEGTDD